MFDPKLTLKRGRSTLLSGVVSCRHSSLTLFLHIVSLGGDEVCKLSDPGPSLVVSVSSNLPILVMENLFENLRFSVKGGSSVSGATSSNSSADSSGMFVRALYTGTAAGEGILAGDGGFKSPGSVSVDNSKGTTGLSGSGWWLVKELSGTCEGRLRLKEDSNSCFF